MRGCEVAWDIETADRIQGLVEEATGMPCPCKRGLPCLVVPREVVLPTPQVRAGEPAA